MSKQTNAIAVHTIGIDTGKNTLHMIGLDENGVIVVREKVSRSRIAARLVNVRPCLVGIEAGMATHYMARELVAKRLRKSRRYLFDHVTKCNQFTGHVVSGHAGFNPD